MRIVIQEMFPYLCHNPGTGQGISRLSRFPAATDKGTYSPCAWRVDKHLPPIKAALGAFWRLASLDKLFGGQYI